MSSSEAKRTAGRPTKYSDSLADEICARLADGESLRHICDSEGMPKRDTVRGWLRDKPEFQAKYVRARKEQADTMADMVLDAARRTEEGKLDPAAARATIGAYQWLAAKLLPKRYGDRQVNENLYPEGLPVQRVEQTTRVLDVADMARVDQKTAMDMYKRLMAGEPARASPHARGSVSEGGKE